jgi:hypothetical protein
MYYLVLFIINGSEYDRRRFETKSEAEGHFSWLYNLPARDHHWDMIQLWEVNEGSPGKLLGERKGL